MNTTSKNQSLQGAPAQPATSWVLLGQTLTRGRTVIATVQMIGEDKEANARLIAAAPDLLAACEVMVAYYSKYPDKYWLKGALKARDAIAKATSR